MTSVSNPVSLAYELYCLGLLSKLVKNKVDSQGVDNTQKILWILNEIETFLMTSRKPIVVLKRFCEVLYHYPSLKEFVVKMEEKLSMYMHTAKNIFWITVTVPILHTVSYYVGGPEYHCRSNNGSSHPT